MQYDRWLLNLKTIGDNDLFIPQKYSVHCLINQLYFLNDARNGKLISLGNFAFLRVVGSLHLKL